MVEFITPDRESKDSKVPKNDESSKQFFTIKRVILIIIAVFVLGILVSSCNVAISPKIAIVPIQGEITTQSGVSLFSQVISSREVADQIYMLADDSTIKVIILDINSPGGSPVASDEISQSIEYAKIQKPVYSVISDLGASGAYWIAASTNRIYSAPLSIVGSIGVTSAGLSFEELIEEYNITYRRQVAGEFKDMGTPFREPSVKEQKKTQELLNSVHEEFIIHVAQHRNLSYEKSKALATGEIFLGKDAQKLGLIDNLSYMQQVIELTQKEFGEELLVIHYDPSSSSSGIFGIKSELNGALYTRDELPINLK